MPRGKKAAQDKQFDPSATGGNGFDPVKLKRFVGEIERCNEELLSERGTYMARCRPIRERISNWKEQASDAGIPRKALNKVLKERGLLADIAALTDGAEEDEIETIDQIKLALGMLDNTPLGAAVVAKAEERRADRADLMNSLAGDDDADLRPTALKEADARRAREAAETSTQEHVATNVERLKGLKETAH